MAFSLGKLEFILTYKCLFATSGDMLIIRKIELVTMLNSKKYPFSICIEY